MARGRKRKYAENARTSREGLLPSTTPTPSTAPTLSTTPYAAALSLPLSSQSLTPLPPQTQLTSTLKAPTTSTQLTTQLHPSSKAATGITFIFHKRFMGGTLYMELGPSEGLGFVKNCVWDPVLSMSKVRDAWEDRASIRMRVMGDIRKDGKQTPWIEERHS
ncbi:hypothetical protein M9H77_14540 [Catharanthus roseus]|uniref:Uncharacterized protein n=1 Tax=Catharanthus roseus TaxID=4058 RepID=A0ACC0BNB9_CATRO|nr:hypothetical protein M9H77_14540 [Catharanthus roseus]